MEETYIEYQFRDEENDYTVGNWEPSSPLQFHDGTHRRNWGLAAAYAYRAYRDDYLLATAVTVWNNMYRYFVTKEQAASGTHPLKNVTFNSACKGGNAGAVFYISDNPPDTEVNGATVCAFMVLSAHLLELTSNSTYRDAADLSANFIKANLFNGAIVNDTISLNGCALTTQIVTYNSGFFIEGLAIYANVTQNSDWTSFLNNLIATTIKFSGWTSGEGIMVEDANGPNNLADTNGFTRALKGIYIRGLYEAWTRSQRGSDVANLIEAYINVQYNALLDLASKDSYNFSSSWPGPAPSRLLPWGQVAALDVLNAGIGMAQASESLSSPPSTSSETPAVSSSLSTNTSNKKSNTPLIVGVTIAAVVVVLGVVLAVFFLRRRNRKNHHVTSLPEPGSLSSHHPGHNAVPSGLRDSTIMAQVNPHASPVEPFTLSSPTTQHLSEKNSGTSPTRSTQTVPITSSRSDTQSWTITGSSSQMRSATDSADGGNDRDDPSAIPGLLERLNRAIARLPQRGSVADEGDFPPEYRER
ncbi:hypothetical protein NLI96_g7761 [Meripilus lineatus]|uniref:mannan endo-1,6-alpha-mannosidase n=1 Tax=Meripilus lineatus TaxID=2056292 RepID=A0AAD5YGY0_9APHY|nr:hypothetical protein NLI96_g7761 [Physisporinus lineatus]